MHGTALPIVTTTPCVNTIPIHLQPDYPGDLQIEKRLHSLIRWNAMPMVVRANEAFPITIDEAVSEEARFPDKDSVPIQPAEQEYPSMNAAPSKR